MHVMFPMKATKSPITWIILFRLIFSLIWLM